MNEVVSSPDGATLATCSDDRTVRLWSVGSRQQIRTLTDHANPGGGVAFSPDGAVPMDDQAVRLLSVRP